MFILLIYFTYIVEYQLCKLNNLEFTFIKLSYSPLFTGNDKVNKLEMGRTLWMNESEFTHNK